MPQTRLTQTIDRPAAQVFRAITDLASFPKWNPTVTHARALTPGPARAGSQFEFTIQGFGKTLQELQEFEDGKQVRLVPQHKGFSGGHRFVLTAKGSQTVVRHDLELEMRGAMRLMTPIVGMMMRRNLRATADALKAYVEAQPSTPRAGP
jgi:uncharacterized protein YndB with AHSA1/START domain